MTCSTVRTKDSWQNDWSQGFRHCDQEELPYCDTCVKVPYQSHIWYSECGSTSAVPATHYCWVQMCISMSHVFILQLYLGLLAPCCNPTDHLKQIPYRDEYYLKVCKSPGMSVTFMMEMLWSTKFHERLDRLMSHCVESILSMSKNEIWATKVLFNGYPSGPSTKDNFHLRWKKSSGSTSSYSKEAT